MHRLPDRSVVTHGVGLHKELRSAFIDRQAENILSVWPGIRPVKTGHAPYICEDIKNTGYETVEVDDSGLPSNYRGRGVCPEFVRSRDFRETFKNMSSDFGMST